jgi:hypothetical protein
MSRSASLLIADTPADSFTQRRKARKDYCSLRELCVLASRRSSTSWTQTSSGNVDIPTPDVPWLQPRDLGLSFVVSAGWTPGITELLPVYAHAQAGSQMDSIESLSVYFSDSGEWSDNALRDGVWHLRQTGLPKPGYFRKEIGFAPRCRMPLAKSTSAIRSACAASVCLPCRNWTKQAAG